MRELTDDNFDEVIAKGIVVVDFWAPWCGPCRQFGPIFEEASNEIPTATFAKLNIDENEEVAQKLGIMSIPTVVFFKDGQEVDKFSGARPKEELRKRVESLQ